MNIDSAGGWATTRRMQIARLRGSNLWRIVRFRMDGQVFEMRLIAAMVTGLDELSAESPIGVALMMARVGDEVEVATPGGNVVVKVLAIL